MKTKKQSGQSSMNHTFTKQMQIKFASERNPDYFRLIGSERTSWC